MPPSPTLTAYPITVLLIDDQPMIGQMLQQMLSSQPDCKFHYCADPTQAVRTANQVCPTVILQDLVMPEIDGLLLVRYFRANPATREVPLIVLSSQEEPVLKAEAFALGVNDYMVKFPDPLEVIARIRSHSNAYINLLQRNEAIEQARRARHEAEVANQVKSLFLANMSHEIRTPMNAILGFTEILHTLVADPMQQEYLNAIETSGQALLTLINDILDLAKIDAGKLKPAYAALDITQVLHDMGVMFSQKIRANQLELFIEIAPGLPRILLLDEIRLRQILLNLIGNAVKFTQRGRITLRARHEWKNPLRRNLALSLAVEDSGIGIPFEQQQTIFEAFQQYAGHPHSMQGGTGLGLTICKRLSEMMGGEITLASEPGKGSTFSLFLPDVEVPPSEQPPLPPADSKPAGTVRFAAASLLLVDDMQLNRKLLKGYLKPYGFTLWEAENGAVAVQMARERHPNLILMDLKMPEMNGDEATRILRGDEATRNIPVVMITASAMEDAESDLRGLCDDYLTKPVSKAQLQQVLQKFLPHSLEIAAAPTPPAPEIPAAPPMPEALRQRLQAEGMIVWRQLGDTSAIDDFEHFAATMHCLGEEFNYPPLIAWAEKLRAAILRFDSTAILEILKEFQDFTPR